MNGSTCGGDAAGAASFINAAPASSMGATWCGDDAAGAAPQLCVGAAAAAAASPSSCSDSSAKDAAPRPPAPAGGVGATMDDRAAAAWT